MSFPPELPEGSHELLIEHSPYCIHSIDTCGRLTQMNPAGLRMMGVQEEAEIRGLPYLNVVSDSDQDRVAGFLKEALAGRESEFEFTASNGQRFLSTFVPIFDPEGNVSSLMGLTQDITQRVEAELALQRSEERLKLALTASGMGVWEFHFITEVVKWSMKVFDIYGVSQKKKVVSFDEYTQMVHPEDLPGLQEALKIARLEPGEFFTEHRVWRQTDGEVRWVQGVGRTFADEHGQVHQLHGTVRDITEQKEAEKQQQASQRLEQLGVLAGGIAHDFNNLLVGVMGGADMLREMLGEDSPMSGSVELILTGARRAAALCQQMLAYAGQGPQHREVIPLRDVLNETSDLVASTLPGGVRLERSLGEVLPAVRADPTQLGQVVLNLLTNAMDAVKSTGGTVTLSGGSGWHSTSQLHRMMPRRELPAGEYAFFEVIDNGCGMSAETCARMFDPFFSTSARGHGLGLAATLGIIGSHGGGICVESQLGAGTQIRVVLPVTEQDYTAAAVVLSSCPVEQRRRVLVIDDEPTVLELVDRALGMKGYEVLLASSGAEGMAMLSDVVPDVVLLDMSMPEMSGLEVMAAIREQHPQLPVILTSGHPQSEAVQLADGFLHKPYRLSTLASTIAAAISSPRRGR